MYKLLMYPQWNYEKVETYLETMEKNGWLLKKILCGCFFKFEKKKSLPRDVKYIYTYTGRNVDGMTSLVDRIKNICNATSISCGRWTSAKFYRVIDMNNGISSLLKKQKQYLKRLYLERFILMLFFLSPCVAEWLLNDSF